MTKKIVEFPNVNSSVNTKKSEIKKKRLKFSIDFICLFFLSVFSIIMTLSFLNDLPSKKMVFDFIIVLSSILTLIFSFSLRSYYAVILGCLEEINLKSTINVRIE